MAGPHTGPAARTGIHVHDHSKAILHTGRLCRGRSSPRREHPQPQAGTCLIYGSSVPFRDIEASLLRQGLVSAGRPSLRPAGASLERENRLVGTVLAAPLAGAALAGLRLLRDHWRDKDED